MTNEFEHGNEHADHLGAGSARKGGAKCHGSLLTPEQVDDVLGVKFDGRIVVDDFVLAEAIEVHGTHDAGEGIDEVLHVQVFEVDGVVGIGQIGDGDRRGRVASCPLEGASFESIGGIAILLVRQELGDEVGTRIGLVLGFARGGLLWKRGQGNHAGLDLHEGGGHEQELAGQLDIDARQVAERVEILLGDPGDGDVVDVDLLLADEVEQEIEGALEGVELDAAGGLHHGRSRFVRGSVVLRNGGPSRRSCRVYPWSMADASAGASEEVAFARSIIEGEADALRACAGVLDERFCEAVSLIVGCCERGGSVLVSGLGKSGLIGAKIASTMASVGVPAHSVHPTEAAHGDLGRFRRDDVCLCLSFSGETQEVVDLAAILRQDGLAVISITGGGHRRSDEEGTGGDRTATSLERLATVALVLGVEREAGEPAFLAPTSSTTATLALGDALALAVARRRSFSNEDFAARHPGGTLGHLLRPVVEVMRARVGRGLVLIPEDVSVGEALAMSEASGRRRSGALLIVDGQGRLSGIFTDGDLRRLVCRDPRGIERRMSDVMTRSPRVLGHESVLRDAVSMVRAHRQDEIPVVDDDGRPVGLLDVQDLVTLRLVRD